MIGVWEWLRVVLMPTVTVPIVHAVCDEAGRSKTLTVHVDPVSCTIEPRTWWHAMQIWNILRGHKVFADDFELYPYHADVRVKGVSGYGWNVALDMLAFTAIWRATNPRGSMPVFRFAEIQVDQGVTNEQALEVAVRELGYVLGYGDAVASWGPFSWTPRGHPMGRGYTKSDMTDRRGLI